MLSFLSRNARAVALAAIGVLGAALVLYFGVRSRRGPVEPFDAMPRDSFLIGTVNLAELRRSPLYEVLFSKGSEARTTPGGTARPLDAKILGLGTLENACGFDPLSRVERLAIGVPEEGDKGELGVAARVMVTHEELSKCTNALAAQRGGKIETKQVGGFDVVEDPASEGAARPRLAFGHDGLLIVGRGAWFDAMLETADGTKPGAKEALAHASMRTSLTSKEGWGQPTVVVTALLPRTLRDRIKNEMGAELGSKDDSQNTMGGVLGVSAVGLAIRAGEVGAAIDAAIELACDGDDACSAVEKLILKKRLDGSKELMLRMIGLGPLLDSIDVKRDGRRVRVTAGASAGALASTIDRVLRRAGSRNDTNDSPSR